jgi:hypothetical protein
VYPEQVKQIEFIIPYAERVINTSLEAETSERVFSLSKYLKWKNKKSEKNQI